MADSAPWRLQHWLKIATAALAYIVVYIGLDSLSYAHDLLNTEISPWSPMIAWMIIIVLKYGPRAVPLTVLTPAIAEIVLRSAAPLSLQALGAAGSIGCAYTAAGLVIRHWQRERPQLTSRWLSLVLAVIAIAALVDALIYCHVLTIAGKLTSEPYLAAVRIDWVGDVNGIIVLLPLLLIWNSPQSGRVRELPARPGLVTVQALSLGAAFWLAFFFTGDTHHDLFYLLFLPVIWIALRWGVNATAFALGTLQLGVVIFVAPQSSGDSFVAVQLLMVLLAATGLYMGISTSENRQLTALVLAHDSQHRALNAQMAVSEMHAAIAHELNNPLAALFNYVRSAGLLLDRPDREPGAVRAVIEKAQTEASRSVDVLSRLRTLYRRGEVHPESVDLRQLASESIATLQTKLQFAEVSCSLEAAPKLPKVLADPLQLSMVLQNLLLNAMDAMSDLPVRRRKIAVRLLPVAATVEVHVIDSGPGMPASISEQLFRPLNSPKATGMGLGLAICRALVEANEGRIWLVSSGADGTEIGFALPAQLTQIS